MGAEVNKFQVFRSIVGALLIDVMHLLRPFKGAANGTFNNQAMFVNIAVIHGIRMVGFEDTSISV